MIRITRKFLKKTPYFEIRNQAQIRNDRTDNDLASSTIHYWGLPEPDESKRYPANIGLNKEDLCYFNNSLRNVKVVRYVSTPNENVPKFFLP